MRLFRLRGRKICDRLLRQGKVWKGSTMIIRWMDGAPRHPSSRPEISGLYVGTLASAKLDKSAVNRNRMRRRCREALRIALKEEYPDIANRKQKTAAPLSAVDCPLSLQLLIAPRSSSLKAPFDALQTDIRAFLSHRFHGTSTATRR